MAQIVTVKPVIMPAQQRADGSWNVKIRVTFKRRYKILSTNLTAFKQDLNRYGELKGDVLSRANLIVRKIYQALAELNWFDLDAMEVEDIVAWIRRYNKGSFRLDFFEYADKFLASKKESTAKTYMTAINSFKEFLGKERFDINSFTLTVLKDYVAAINSSEKKNNQDKDTTDKSARKPRKRGVAAKIYISRLKTIYLEAQNEYNDDDAGVRNIPSNPFARLTIDAEPSVARIAKSPEFVQKIIDGKAKAKEGQRLALDIYMISFALMGANTADLMTMTPPDKDGIVTYYRAKTKDRRADRAEMRVRIEPCVRPLFERYADPSGELLLNFAGRWKNAISLNSFLAKNYKTWAEDNGEDPFTIYSARHSWATIGRSNKVGLSKSLIDECLAHSTNKLVDVYAEKDWSILWEANRKVLDLFDWNNI